MFGTAVSFSSVAGDCWPVVLVVDFCFSLKRDPLRTAAKSTRSKRPREDYDRPASAVQARQSTLLFAPQVSLAGLGSSCRTVCIGFPTE